MYRIITLLIVVSILSGCANLFNSRYQDVRLTTNGSSCRFYVDTAFAGSGKEVTCNVYRDLEIKKIRIEADSCKPVKGIIMQDSKSSWYLLTYLTLGIGLAWDFSPNTWYYEDSFIFEAPKPYPYWSAAKKRIYIDNVGEKTPDGKYRIDFYYFKEYAAGKVAEYTMETDKYIRLNGMECESYLEDQLAKLNFIDTLNTIFPDKQNSLFLKCNLQNLTMSAVSSLYFPAKNYDGDVMLNKVNYGISFKLKALWTVTDIYGDTLYADTIEGKSGTYPVDIKGVDRLERYGPQGRQMAMVGAIKERAYVDPLNDAVECTFIDLMSKPRMKELVALDTTTERVFAKLAIARPGKNPGTMEEAMKAGMTIKAEDGHGSGFLITHDGYIITNYHVINQKKNLKAIDTEGKEYTLIVVRYNKAFDLALLKVEGNFEYALTLPGERNFKNGQAAFAIGTPKSVSLGQSLSKGIISGYRTSADKSYIQTDIAVNSGNSGGAIVSSTGELLGVVEFKMSGTGVEGLSFAIPAFDIMKALALSYQRL